MKIACYHGKSVEFWVAYINDNYDIDQAANWIVQMVEKHPWETVLAGLQHFEPEIATEPYLPWFKKLYERVKETAADAPGAAAVAEPEAEPAAAAGKKKSKK